MNLSFATARRRFRKERSSEHGNDWELILSTSINNVWIVALANKIEIEILAYTSITLASNFPIIVYISSILILLSDINVDAAATVIALHIFLVHQKYNTNERKRAVESTHFAKKKFASNIKQCVASHHNVNDYISDECLQAFGLYILLYI